MGQIHRQTLNLTNTTNNYSGGTVIESGPGPSTTGGTPLGTGTVTVTAPPANSSRPSGVQRHDRRTTSSSQHHGRQTSPGLATARCVYDQNGGTLTLSGSVSLAAATQITSYCAGGTMIFSQPIGGTGPLTLHAGANVGQNQTFILQGGPSTYTGPPTLNGGDMQAACAIVQLQGGSLPSTTVRHLQDGTRGGTEDDAVLDLNGHNQTVGGLTYTVNGGLGAFVVNSSSQPLHPDDQATADNTFAGVIGVNTAATSTDQAAVPRQRQHRPGQGRHGHAHALRREHLHRRHDIANGTLRLVGVPNGVQIAPGLWPAITNGGFETISPALGTSPNNASNWTYAGNLRPWSGQFDGLDLEAAGSTRVAALGPAIPATRPPAVTPPSSRVPASPSLRLSTSPAAGRSRSASPQRGAI